MKDFLDWLDDKHFVILVIMSFGLTSLYLEVDGSLALIEKMAYGLLGMAVGKHI